jgi:hypothetical protein
MHKSKIILLLLLSNLINGQSKKGEEKPKINSIGLEFYKPIDNELSEFYGFNYGLGNTITGTNDHSNNSISTAFGISYERICKNNVIFRSRVGISIIRNDVEQISKEAAENPAIYSINYNYKQNQINVFIGVGKRVDLTNKVVLDLGLDVASIYYSKGKGDFNSTRTQTDLSSGDIFVNVSNVRSEMGKVNSFGIGPFIKPEVTVYKNITVALELQMYFLKTTSGEGSYQIETFDQYVNNVNTQHTESETSVNNDLNIWKWTKVSPLIRLGYKF